MTDQAHNASWDGMRGIAAFAVVWGHMTLQAFKVPTPFHDYLAVDFFFILSGVVVAAAYGNRMATSMSFIEFARARLIRLYPLVVLALLIGFAAKLYAAHYQPAEGVAPDKLVESLLLGLLLIPYDVQPAGGTPLFPLDVPLWSLMFEIWANLLFAAICMLRRHAIVLAVLVAVLLAGTAADILIALHDHGLDGGWSFGSFPAGFGRVGCSFFLGVILARGLTPKRVAALPAVPFPMLALVLAVILCAGPDVGGWYDLAAALLVFPAIIVLGARDAATGRWRKLAAWAGMVSYPVYVLHETTFSHFTHFQGRSLAVTLPVFCVAFAGILITSHLAAQWYDLPVRRWLSWHVPGGVQAVAGR